MKKINSFILLFIVITSTVAYAQKGKDGVKTISTANVKINEFTALTSNALANTSILNVAASGLNTNARFTSTLTAGDLVMIIQMQGALMKLSPVPVWAPDSTYGKIYDYNSCGNYEFAQVKSVISSTQIELECGLTHSYSSVGKTQIVRVPRYSSLNIASTGTLTTDAWNGTIGGVLVAEIDGNTTVNSGGLITSVGLGFRGGVALGNGGTGNGNYATKNPNDGAEKGEGIGSDRLNNLGHDTIGKQCMGAPANGGGGGNSNNCGGGGGANAGNISNWNGYGVLNATYSAIFDLEYAGRGSVTSSGGGKGGYGTSTTNNSPVTNGPNNSIWGSFLRPARGGFGGHPLDYSSGKLFMGGGGGSGHMSSSQSNGANACSGGAGGGIIYFLNYGTISGTGTITANGANGNNSFGSSFTSAQGIDGAGGGGGGGTILLNSIGTVSSIIANANGGNGGNQVKSGLSSTEAQGPGGGGGGGYIASNGSSFTQNVYGGINGTTNASVFSGSFPMNGATSGNTGLNNQSISSFNYSLTVSSNQTLCTGNATTLIASSSNPTATIMWFNSAAGGNAIATGTVYTTPVYSVVNTYTVYAGSCPGIYRQPIIITVNSNGLMALSNQTICAGQTTTLTTTTSAASYSWNTGATTNSIVISPSVTTEYTVTGINGICTAQATATIVVLSQPTVAVTSSSICSGTSATLTALGASNYTWLPSGALTQSIVVTPTITTNYTITGANGNCFSQTTATVFATTTPTLSLSNQTICAGQTITLSPTGLASSYSWNTGATTNSIVISPSVTTEYTVTGINGICTAQATATIVVLSQPTVAVTSSSICSGASVTLTALGASNYTWLPSGALTQSIVVTPTITTNYTITGANGNCFSQTTATVFVTTTPTLSLSNQSICAGQTITLSPTGLASSYLWNTGATASSIVITPTATANYTLTGTNANCSATTTATVVVNNNLSISVNNASVCIGQTATLTANGASTYTWSNNSNLSSITISPTITSTYTVSGTSSACSGSAIATVVVHTLPTITVNSTTICSGQTATLTANGATTYTWSTGETTSSIFSIISMTCSLAGTDINGCTNTQTANVTVNNTPTLTVNSTTVCNGNVAIITANGATTYTWNTGVNTNSLQVTPNTTTMYTVTGANSNCVSQTTTTVFVINNPSIAVTSATICQGNSTTLNATGATSYTWNSISTGNSQLYSPTQTTTYSVIGSSGNCTSAMQIATVTVIDVVANFTLPNSPVSVNSTINLLNTSTNATSYVWTFCNGNSSTNTNVIMLTGNAGTCCISLLATNNTCSSTTIQCTEVVNDASVIIPNVFTPNNDGKNDAFKISFVGVKNISLFIYNRWGLQLAAIISNKNSGNIEWDGANASDGTYFYVVEYTDLKDVSKTEKGFLNLFRD